MQALQFKIVLKDSRPPIWRRVIIREDATFWDLHSIIQDLFEWEDEHLHEFRNIHKRTEDRHYFEVNGKEEGLLENNSVAIRPGEPRDYFHNERQEKLVVWFSKEHPKFIYIYDFGDYWQHEIVLEKLVDVPRLKLAKYLGGERRGLEEDSRPDGLLDCESIVLSAEKRNAWWKEIIEIYGKSRANRILIMAQKEAARPAPRRIKFSDPEERYKIAEAIGMFN